MENEKDLELILGRDYVVIRDSNRDLLFLSFEGIKCIERMCTSSSVWYESGNIIGFECSSKAHELLIDSLVKYRKNNQHTP